MWSTLKPLLSLNYYLFSDPQLLLSYVSLLIFSNYFAGTPVPSYIMPMVAQTSQCKGHQLGCYLPWLNKCMVPWPCPQALPSFSMLHAEIPGPPAFQRATLKRPGDEAMVPWIIGHSAAHKYSITSSDTVAWVLQSFSYKEYVVAQGFKSKPWKSIDLRIYDSSILWAIIRSLLWWNIILCYEDQPLIVRLYNEI